MKFFVLLLLYFYFSSCVNHKVYTEEEIAVSNECNKIVDWLREVDTLNFYSSDSVLYMVISNVDIERYNSRSSFGINRELEEIKTVYSILENTDTDNIFLSCKSIPKEKSSIMEINFLDISSEYFLDTTDMIEDTIFIGDTNITGFEIVPIDGKAGNRLILSKEYKIMAIQESINGRWWYCGVPPQEPDDQ